MRYDIEYFSYVFHSGNAILVAMIEVLEYHSELWSDRFKPSDFLIVLTGLEVIIVLIALLRYLSKIFISIERLIFFSS